MLVLGDATELPWVDGARYLGWEAGLLLPTSLTCSPPPSLVRDALPAAPLRALLPDVVLLSDRPARPLDPDQLGAQP